MKILILETKIQGREDFIVRNIKNVFSISILYANYWKKILLGVEDMQKKIRKIVVTLKKI